MFNLNPLNWISKMFLIITADKSIMLWMLKPDTRISPEITKINPSASLINTNQKDKMNPFYREELHHQEEIPLPWQEELNLLTSWRKSRNNAKIHLIQDKCGKLKMKKETIQTKTEGKTETYPSTIVKI